MLIFGTLYQLAAAEKSSMILGCRVLGRHLRHHFGSASQIVRSDSIGKESRRIHKHERKQTLQYLLAKPQSTIRLVAAADSLALDELRDQLGWNGVVCDHRNYVKPRVTDRNATDHTESIRSITDRFATADSIAGTRRHI